MKRRIKEKDFIKQEIVVEEAERHGCTDGGFCLRSEHPSEAMKSCIFTARLVSNTEHTAVCTCVLSHRSRCFVSGCSRAITEPHVTVDAISSFWDKDGSLVSSSNNHSSHSGLTSVLVSPSSPQRPPPPDCSSVLASSASATHSKNQSISQSAAHEISVSG